MSETNDSLRRKASKRAVLSSDDEEEPNSPVPPMKRQRLDEENDFVDIDGGDDLEDFGGDDLESFSSSRPKRRLVKPGRYEDQAPPTTKRTTTARKGGVSKKRKKAAKSEHSDADSEDDFAVSDEDDLVQDLETLNDDDDEDFEDDTKPGKSRGRKGGGRGQKGKAKETTKQPPRKRAARVPLVVNTSMILDTGSPPDEYMDSPVEPSASQPKPKAKLPAIKKNKTGGTSTPTVRKPLLPPKGTQEEDITTVLRQKAAPPPSTTDVDLSNSGIYAELFKVGTPSARTSNNSREEQRRKELDKMRDEARAARAAESRGSFALQAQMEKILKFEEKLRKSASPSLYPNILAAKMRQVQDAEAKRIPRPPQGLEEGEM